MVDGTQGEWARISAGLAHLMTEEGPPAVWTLLDEMVRSLEPRETPGGFEFLSHSISLAAQYGEIARARRWIDAARARLASQALGDRLSTRHRRAAIESNVDAEGLAALRALQVVLELALRSRGGLEEALSRLDWNHAPREEWAAVARILAAETKDPGAGLVKALSECTAPSTAARVSFVNPYWRGSLLRLLGTRSLAAGKTRRALGFYRAALRSYARDPGVTARLREIEVHHRWGFILAHESKLDAAEACLVEAAACAGRYRHERLQGEALLTLSHVKSCREDFAEAAELAMKSAGCVSRTRLRTPDGRSQRATALANAANALIDLGDLRSAAALLARARRFLPDTGANTRRALFHLVRGRLRARRGRKGDHPAALADFDAAEALYRSEGEEASLHCGFVRLARAGAYLRASDLDSARNHARLCAETFRETPFHQLRTDCLVLHSELLLCSTPSDREGLYGAVFEALGDVREPAKRLRILANLYFYTWLLPDKLEASARLLEEIESIGKTIPRPRFERLYEEHVLSRMRKMPLFEALRPQARASVAPYPAR